MIRVLFMQSSPVYDAIASTQVQLARSLDRSEFDVHVACTALAAPKGGPSVLDRIRAMPELKLHVAHLGPSLHGPSKSRGLQALVELPRLPLGLVSLAEYLRRERIDIVHVGPKPRDVYAVLFAKLLGIRTVFHIHFQYGDWMPKSVKWAMNNADFVIGVSKFSADSV